jgi:uncharacterized protein DUF4019
MRIGFASVLAVMLLVTSSCGLAEGKDFAEKATDQFHQQFNGEQYSEIYAGADAQFKRATTEAALTQYLQAVRRKLGTFKQARQTNFNIVSGTDGTSVTMVYASEFTQGNATEQFLYAIVRSKGILVGYNINSPDLILR